MKKLDGIVPPTFVLADEGKNGLAGPPPSPSIVRGGSIGFTIRCAARHRSAPVDRATTGTVRTTYAAATTTVDQRGIRAQSNHSAVNSTAAAARPACAASAMLWARVAPTAESQAPMPAQMINASHAADAASVQRRRDDARYAMARIVTTAPRTTWMPTLL